MEQIKALGLFPGQGSQKVGMGKSLWDNYGLAKELFQQADQKLGLPLSKFCFEGPEERLTQTEIAQPAILTVSLISYFLCKQQYGTDFSLVAAAGHSLGEYSALVAAGALSFDNAVLLVHKRGKFMQRAVPVGAGRMVAVMGKEVEELEDILKTITSGVAEIANINTPGQIVVSGASAAIEDFTKALAGAKFIDLPVSAPFHCSLMKPAEEELSMELLDTHFSPCNFPVYANFSAQPVTQPDEIRKSLSNQVCGRVRWVESMQNAIKEHSPAMALEFGATPVLNNMLKRIDPSLKRAQIDSPEGFAKLG